MLRFGSIPFRREGFDYDVFRGAWPERQRGDRPRSRRIARCAPREVVTVQRERSVGEYDVGCGSCLIGGPRDVLSGQNIDFASLDGSICLFVGQGYFNDVVFLPAVILRNLEVHGLFSREVGSDG